MAIATRMDHPKWKNCSPDFGKLARVAAGFSVLGNAVAITVSMGGNGRISQCNRYLVRICVTPGTGIPRLLELILRIWMKSPCKKILFQAICPPSRRCLSDKLGTGFIDPLRLWGPAGGHILNKDERVYAGRTGTYARHHPFGALARVDDLRERLPRPYRPAGLPGGWRCRDTQPDPRTILRVCLSPRKHLSALYGPRSQ